MKVEKEVEEPLTTSVQVDTKLQLLSAVCFIVGSMIGSGIFVTAATSFKLAGSAGLGLLIWLGCGFLATVCALCYAELGTMLKKSGGEFIYLKEAFGDAVAFSYLWVTVFIYKPSAMAILSLAFSNYVLGSEIVSCLKDVLLTKLVASLCIGLVMLLNCVSVTVASRTQVVFTMTKLLALSIIVITGVVQLSRGYTQNFEDIFAGSRMDVASIGYAFYSGLWAYNGWNNLNYVTEDVENPERTIPLAITIAIPLVTCFYVFVNVAYLSVLSIPEMANSGAIAVTIANQLYGPMAWIMPVAVACSTFGSANGSMFSASRLIQASAKQGQFPSLFASKQRTLKTPVLGVLLNGTIALVMLIPESSNFENLLQYFSFASWFFYGSTMVALLVLRYRKPNAPRPFRVFILCPIVAALASVYLVASPFVEKAVESSICLAVILAAIPVYYLLVRNKPFPNAFYSALDRFYAKFDHIFDMVYSE